MKKVLTDEEIERFLKEHNDISSCDIPDEVYRTELIRQATNNNPFALFDLADNYFEPHHGFKKDVSLGYAYFKKLNELTQYTYLSSVISRLYENNMYEEIADEQIKSSELGFNKTNSFIEMLGGDDEIPAEEFYKNIFNILYPIYVKRALAGSYGACLILSEIFKNNCWWSDDSCLQRKDIHLSDYFKQLANKLKLSGL